jgi:hypothetical protein
VAGVVEVAADPGGATAGGLRLKVQHLPDNTRLPEKPAIPPWAASSGQEKGSVLDRFGTGKTVMCRWFA